MHLTKVAGYVAYLASLISSASGSSFETGHVQPDHRHSDHSFAGVNSYFLHAFQSENRTAVLDAIHDAGLRLVRVFISETPANNKGTGSVYMPDIEPIEVGRYDDTQLEALDVLMVEAHARDIKLVIAVHDRYQLGCWGNDTYSYKYDLPRINCAVTSVVKNNVTSWYLNSSAINDYDNRIRHILEHRNCLLPGAPKWKDLSEHIFAFNIENEGEGHLNNNTAPVPEWWCDRSRFMRHIMGKSGVRISTGGGNEFPNSDIPQNWACETLDVVDVHSYSDINTYRQLAPRALQHALTANKLIIFEEFGATGASKAQILGQYIDFFNSMGVPWMPWEISKPGKGASDFEFWIDEPAYGVVKNGSEQAQHTRAAQSFSQHDHRP